VKARHAAVWIACLTLGARAAGPASPDLQPVHSASGQFTVLQPDIPGPSAEGAFLSEAGLLHLDPTLLTISAERLRQHLTRELGDSSPWEGRIIFSLHRTGSFDAPVYAVGEWQGDGWQYQVSLPDYLRKDRFIRALVEVNLMEIANRSSSGRAAEIPDWLTEGLTARLLVSRSLEIILPQPQLALRSMKITPWVVEEINYQPLALAHAQMRTNTPLTIEQLSWPTEDSFRGPKGQAYRHCAHLLVARLLELPDGSALMNAFIRNLGRHYNWQVAFLDTYQARFPSQLDLEKWWALQVALFTGRELGAHYAYEDSVLRLQQAVRFPVEVRLGTNALPMHGAVRLQTIIQEWDMNRQTRALNQTLQELVALRARIAPELIGLLDDYRLALEHYLRNRNRKGLYLPKGVNRQPALTGLIRRTLSTLDELDAELAGLTPEQADKPALANSKK